MSGWLGPRFGLEVAILIGVAAILLLVEASWEAVAGSMFAAWLVIAAFELAFTRRRPAAESVEMPAVAMSGGDEPRVERHVPAEPAAAVAAGPETVRVLPEPPASEAVEEEPPAAEAQPEPEPEPAEPEAAEPELEEAEPLPPPPPPPVLVPVPTPAAPEPRTAPEPEPEPEPVAPAAAETVVPLYPSAPREWNLWELERLARGCAGEDPLRDEEWSFLLLHLREFASPDGALSRDFDELVRESFGELLAAAR